MKTKWKIKGIDNFRFGEDKNLYKLPYNSNKRYYGFRLIKMQYGERWKIDGKWWSKRQLKDKLIKDDEPLIIYEEMLDSPF